MNEEELQTLSRHDLQQEAMKLGIKANQSSSVLIQLILERSTKATDDSSLHEADVQEKNETELNRNPVQEKEEREETVYISDGETNLVEDLDRILEGESHVSLPTNTSKIHSDIDTLTLQDILNRADTTFIGPNDSLAGSNEPITSSENTSQSRLPSLSKNIISMLIDMDNANYGKKEEESIIANEEKDPRLSQTVISEMTQKRQENPPTMELSDLVHEKNPTAELAELVQNSNPTAELTELTELAELADSTKLAELLRDINPTTCLYSISDDNLSKLCTIFKKRVMTNGNSEDMDILLNINSELSDRISRKTIHSVDETNYSYQPLVREGSLIVTPRPSVITSEAAKQDSWEKGTGVMEEENDNGTVEITPFSRPLYQEESSQLVNTESIQHQDNPISSETQMDPSSTPPVHSPEYQLKPLASQYRSRNRKTIISSYRLKEIEEGVELPGSPQENEDESLSDEPSKQLEDSLEQPNECTYIQVSIDLENPAVPVDDEEAQLQFKKSIENSVETLQKDTTLPPFIMELHQMLQDNHSLRRESLIMEARRRVEEAIKEGNSIHLDTVPLKREHSECFQESASSKYTK